VLIAIAVLTAVCAAYSLLVATGVLGNAYGGPGPRGRRTDQLRGISLLRTRMNKSPHEALGERVKERLSRTRLPDGYILPMWSRWYRIALAYVGSPAQIPSPSWLILLTHHPRCSWAARAS
jgi:hypothetical protein